MAAPPQNTTLSVAHHHHRRKNKCDHAAGHQANNNVRASYNVPRCTGRRAARRFGHAPSTSRHATSTAGAGEGDRQADLPPPPPHIHMAAEPSDTGYSAERRRGTPEGPTATPKATLRLDCTYMSQHRGYQSLSPPVCFSLHRFPCLSPPTTHHVTITGGCTRERWGGGQTSRRGEKPTYCRDSTHD